MEAINLMPDGSSNAETQLWVDKYAPTRSTDLVGNLGAVASLAHWLRTWQVSAKKAVLITGPPGIGKTCAAHIVSREAGFDIVEMSHMIEDTVTNSCLRFDPQSEGRRQLLLVDEVDNVERGVQDLIRIIRRSRVPIICIANDKYCQKLRSLRGHCLELDFHAPAVNAMLKRLCEVVALEGLQATDAALREQTILSGGDMRQLLGQLQMKASFAIVRDRAKRPFDCARMLLDPGATRLDLEARLELHFADPYLVPLLVQENYVNHARVHALAKAAEAISAGDVLSSAHMPDAEVGVVSTLMPAAYVMGPRARLGLPSEQPFPRFTAWLGSCSTGNKQRRRLADLTTVMSASAGISHSLMDRRTMRLDYLPALRHMLSLPLQQHAAEGVHQVVSLMREYLISRERYDYVMDVTHFKTRMGWGQSMFKDLPATVKSAFTRRVNKEGLISATPGGGVLPAPPKS
jgi:replication factor C subunit 1